MRRDYGAIAAAACVAVISVGFVLAAVWAMVGR